MVLEAEHAGYAIELFGAWIPAPEWSRLDTATNPEMVHHEWETA